MAVWSPKQADFIVSSTARLNIAVGAVRSGKTVCSLARWIHYIATAPPGDLYMVGKSERTLKRNCILPMQRILGLKRCLYNEGSGELRVGDRGRQRLVYVVGANDARSTTKIQGATAAGLYGDEFVTWPEEFFKMATTRLSVAGSKAFLTANPDNPRHWAKKDFIDRAEEVGAKCWHFTLDDNPFLDPVVVADLKRTFQGLWYRRLILGEWCVAEGAVYDGWGEHLLCDELPEMRLYLGGIDYGTSNPFCFLLMGLGVDDCWYVVREWFFEPDPEHGVGQKTDAQFVQAVAQACDGFPVEVVFCDPSAASFIVAARQAGLPIVRGNNDVLDGIRSVAALMGAGRFKVKRGVAPHLQASFDSYVWDPKAQARGEDKPLKKDDHPADAARYLIYSYLGPAEGSAVVGPEVMLQLAI